MNGGKEEGDEEGLAFFLGGEQGGVVLMVDAEVEAMPVSCVNGGRNFGSPPVGWVRGRW